MKWKMEDGELRFKLEFMKQIEPIGSVENRDSAPFLPSSFLSEFFPQFPPFSPFSSRNFD